MIESFWRFSRQPASGKELRPGFSSEVAEWTCRMIDHDLNCRRFGYSNQNEKM